MGEYVTRANGVIEEVIEKERQTAADIGAVPGEVMERFKDMALRGKKIRGALMLLGYRLAGGRDEDRLIRTSVFIELLHAGLLIHDDIMDRDDKRRGMVSMHKYFTDKAYEMDLTGNARHYGEAVAICGGDLAYFLSFKVLMEAGFPAERVVEAGRVYADYALRIAYGQLLDVTNTKIHLVSEKEILNVFKYKTAEYTGSLPLLLGAILAGEKDKQKLQRLHDYGVALGWAFQVQDDLLGMFGDEEIGKPVGSDLREGKNTLLMLYLFKKGNKEQREFQKAVLGKNDISPDEVEKMKKILKESGVYDEVYQLGMGYVEEGQKLAEEITEDKGLQGILKALMSFMMERVR